MIPQRVSLVTLGAKDLPKLRAFYQNFGWEEAEISSDNYAVFKTAGVLLSIFPLAELVKDAGLEVAEQAEGFRGITLAINVDKQEDVDAATKTAEKAGARILRQPSDAFWGGRTSYFADPENNVWEIAWNPTSVFDERGAMISL